MTLFVVINIIVMLGLMALLYMMQKACFFSKRVFTALGIGIVFDSLCILYMVRLQKRLRRLLIGLISQAAAMSSFCR